MIGRENSVSITTDTASFFRLIEHRQVVAALFDFNPVWVGGFVSLAVRAVR
jgi:hypothetical protein